MSLCPCVPAFLSPTLSLCFRGTCACPGWDSAHRGVVLHGGAILPWSYLPSCRVSPPWATPAASPPAAPRVSVRDRRKKKVRACLSPSCLGVQKEPCLPTSLSLPAFLSLPSGLCLYTSRVRTRVRGKILHCGAIPLGRISLLVAFRPRVLRRRLRRRRRLGLVFGTGVRDWWGVRGRDLWLGDARSSFMDSMQGIMRDLPLFPCFPRDFGVRNVA